jgi:hypothetical protein
LTEAVQKRKNIVVPDATIWDKASTSIDINKDDNLTGELNKISTRF